MRAATTSVTSAIQSSRVTPPRLDSEPLSVVSRWDLQVVDDGVLIQAGRAAHRRLHPEENDEDAGVAVPTAGHALYALLHATDEPWYDMPGVAVVRGARAFVRPRQSADRLADEDDSVGTITEPPSERLFGDTWA